jgi:hypothetical protein
VKAKLTVARIREIRAEAKTTGKTLFCWDTQTIGFGALATAKGVVSYFIQFRLGGREVPCNGLVIGRHDALTPKEARRLAKIELGRIAGLKLRRKMDGLLIRDASA